MRDHNDKRCEQSSQAIKEAQSKLRDEEDRQKRFKEEMLLVWGYDVMDNDPIKRGQRMIDEGQGGKMLLEWTAFAPLANAVDALGSMMIEGVSVPSLWTVVDSTARMSTGKVGEPIPSAKTPHTQLGWREGRKGGYRQTREWGHDSKPKKITDWTDHGRPKEHPSPHDHFFIPNETGGSLQHGPAVPFSIDDY